MVLAVATAAMLVTPTYACHTVVSGEACYEDVIWAMNEGISSHPEWYPGLHVGSSFEDFQRSLYDKNMCSQLPCQPPSPGPGPVPGPSPCPPSPGFFRLSGWSVPPEPFAIGAQFPVDCEPHTTVRLDPIFSEGYSHDHMHTVFGADRFGTKLTVEDMTYPPNELPKTTCNVPSDGSIYWTPTLYKREGGRLRQVRTTLTVYYKNDDGNSGAANTPLRHLPPGLKLLRGNPSRQTPFTATDDSNGEHMYWCESGMIGTPTRDGGFPTDMRKWQFDIYYPSCWDESSLDCIDRQTGEMPCMAFAVNNRCPDSHPYRIPKILAEIHYWVNELGGSREDYVFSTGDTRGYSAHLDIVAGWQPDMLHAAIANECNKGGACNPNNPNCPFKQFCGLNGSPPGALPPARRDVGSYRAINEFRPNEPVDNIPGSNPPHSKVPLPISTVRYYNCNDGSYYHKTYLQDNTSVVV